MKETGGVGHPVYRFHPNMAAFYINIYMYLAPCCKNYSQME